MNPKLIAALLLVASLPLAAHAADGSAVDGHWTGTGELGFAMTHGNTRSETLNAKLNLKREDDTWKNTFHLSWLRNKGEVQVSRIVDGEEVSAESFETTANRFEAATSTGYKLTPRSYIVGALRYEHDDFASYRWQAAASVGYGYIMIRNPQTELSFELGPGYKRVQPTDRTIQTGTPPVVTTITPTTEGEGIVRGRAHYRHAFNQQTAIQNTLLIEAGSNGRFVQNDLSLAVNLSDKLALKISQQTRYNSAISPGNKHVDRLLTTNLVYSF